MKKFLVVLISICCSYIHTNAQCNGVISYTMNPAPIGNQFPPGTVVEVCCTMVGYNMVATNWIEGFQIQAGAGWLTGSITPISAPANCNGGAGNWIWLTSFTNGPQNYGPGYFFDYDNDGISHDDYGDYGSCTWTYCYSITVGNTIGASLVLGTAPMSDGYGCGSYGINVLPLSYVVGPPCSISGTVDSQTNISCFNDSNGTSTLLVSGGTLPYTYTLDSSIVSQTPLFENLSAGSYNVLVTDSMGCTTQIPFDITAPQAPFEAVILNVNDTVFCVGNQLQLYTDSNALFSYQWMLNGTSISSATMFNYLTDSAGTYTVLVTNENNCTAISSPIQIAQMDNPTIISSPNDTTILDNENGIFVVTTTADSLNLLTYQWQENSGTGFTNLTNSSTYNGIHTDTLIISNVSLNFDSLQYRCVISNSYCNSISETATLYVSELTTLNMLNKDFKHRIKIIPNPAIDFITIETNDLSIGKSLKIIDIYGHILLNHTVLESRFTLSKQALAKGIYFVQIDERFNVEKLIIE